MYPRIPSARVTRKQAEPKVVQKQGLTLFLTFPPVLALTAYSVLIS